MRRDRLGDHHVRAAVFDRYGPPEVVRLDDVPTPRAAEDQLLVKVHSTTVNRTDNHYRAAKPFVMRFVSGLVRPRAKILGNEFAGTVAAIGSSVTTFSVGDRVFGFSGSTYGGHAEHVVIPADGCVARIPTGVSFDEAAPATEGSHYALSHLRSAGLRRGHDVLVYGATGAIGSAAVQLVKSHGASVTAVCATPHVELVKGLGADRVLDYTSEDLTNVDQRYDVILDAYGKLSYFRCRHLFKPGGMYTSAGPGPLYVNLALLWVKPLLRNKVVFSAPTIDHSTVSYLAQLMESGQFRPVIDRYFSLEQIVEAYRYVETGEKIGNVVITITASS